MGVVRHTASVHVHRTSADPKPLVHTQSAKQSPRTPFKNELVWPGHRPQVHKSPGVLLWRGGGGGTGGGGVREWGSIDRTINQVL